VPLAAAPATSVTKDKVNIGVIGAGQFAKGILLPAFAQQDAVRFGGFCTSSGLTSKHIAGKYNADFCTSDPDDIIGDDNIDAVLIATRHDQHAALATKALQAGKAVFTEKPLAITRESLLELCKVAEQDGAPRLMVGYNRRFAPLAVQCHDFFAPCQDGLFASYRVNAGHFPPESWVYDPVVGGGRILGEVCHFVDFLCYLTDSLPERITATELMQAGERAVARDNVSITLQMRDGSIGTIHYLANGDTSVSKEYVEVFGGRRTAILDNYRTLSMHQNNKLRKKRLLNQAKGFQQEVAAFINAVKGGGPMPIDWETLLAVTQTTFLIHRSLDSGGTVNYEAPTGQPAALDD
jgi:predicted dehydrogenase